MAAKNVLAIVAHAPCSCHSEEPDCPRAGAATKNLSPLTEGARDDR
jgi:hypothetical protein